MRAVQLVAIALDGLRRAPVRSVLTVLGVAISSAALVAMVAFAVGLENAIVQPFEQLGLLDEIRVSEPDDEPRRPAPDRVDGAGDADAPRAAPPPLDDAALARFEAIPGVALAYPELRLRDIEVEHGEHSEAAFAVGVPRATWIGGFFDDLLAAGRFFAPGDAAEALCDVQLAKALGFDEPAAAVGATVRIRVSGAVREAAGDTGSGTVPLALEHARIELRVAGVFRAPAFGPGFRRNTLLLPVDLMRSLPGVGLETNLQRVRALQGSSSHGRVIVRAGRVTDVPRIEAAIEELGYEARAMVDELDRVRGFFVFLEVLLAAVGSVALVVAGLGILNTLFTTVIERVAEIGLYKAIGATSGDVRVVFLAEAATVGLLGGLLGILFARLVCAGLQLGIDAYAESQGVDVPIEVFRFPALLLAGAVAFAVVVSVVSGLYPASRAANVDPIRALRGE